MSKTTQPDDRQYPLIDIAAFRAAHDLPPDFGVRAFEGKDYTNTGSLEDGAHVLSDLRDAVLNAVPSTLNRAELPAVLERLTTLFRLKLIEINETIRLHAPEIDFAVAGFSDALHAFLYAIIPLRGEALRSVDPAAIYRQWQNASLRLTVTVHPYPHRGEVWSVQVMNNVYGRIGLQVTTPHAVYYVRDQAYTCPAEGFMSVLIRQVCQRIIERLL